MLGAIQELIEIKLRQQMSSDRVGSELDNVRKVEMDNLVIMRTCD